MTEFLYEKDLLPQKYRILVTPRHDKLVREIAADLEMPVQELRRYLIDHLDMLLLENLPARAEAAMIRPGHSDPLGSALGRTKYTVAVPVISAAAMESICHEVTGQVDSGIAASVAVAYGKLRIREVMRQ